VAALSPFFFPPFLDAPDGVFSLRLSLTIRAGLVPKNGSYFVGRDSLIYEDSGDLTSPSFFEST